ncbi:HelD family protein [Streptomyces sp. NPDC127077]|uniref:HelD family protein n=1 Tax=Streptomyces sp. NPDC127077 TaxID=3347131 RepID=UPI003650BDA7
MTSAQRHVVIAREQQGVDRAYACLANRRSQDASANAVYRAHNEMPAPGAGGAEAAARGDDPLVVMRVQTKDGDSFLIGRQPLWNEERDLVVVSSAAQRVVDWRLATQDNPGEVLLRRKLNFRRQPNVVSSYFDELVLRQYDPDLDEGLTVQTPEALSEPEASPQQTSAPTAATPADDQDAPPSLESLLLDDLDLPRDGTMRDIVETVQREQLLLVAHPRPGALIIQGGPGTGKTAVGLYRVMWLLDNEHCSASDVLVVGPHRSFLTYAGQVLPALGGGDVATLTFDQLLAASSETPASHTDSQETAFLKGDDRMADVLRRAVEAYCRPTRARVAPLLADRDDDEAIFRFACGGRTYEADADALLTLARQALAESGPFNVRQNNFRLRLAGKLLLSVPGATPEDILASKEVATFIQRVWPRLNAADVYTRLLDSARTLQAAAPLLTSEEQSALVRSPSRGKSAWTAADRVCLDELQWLLHGAQERTTYQHIVVDEAQDLTPMQARALARRCPSGSMTLLGDLAQATGPHSYRSWRELAGILTTGTAWTVELLQAGFRLPPEVAHFVEPLARAVAPRMPVARSIRPASGQSVWTQTADNTEQLIQRAVGRVVEIEITSGQHGRSIAVIVPVDESLQSRIRTELEAIHLTSVPVLQSHETKGIEFDHVVLVEPAAIAGDTRSGLRNLYVALTRCTQSLSVVHHAALPPSLSGEDHPSPTEIAPIPQETAPTMSFQPASTTSTEPPAAFEHYLQTAVAQDRTQPTHERLRHRLLAQLWESGQPEDGTVADIIHTSENGTFLLEVLHAEHPTYADLRDAAARTAEIRFATKRQIDQVVLVCANTPAETWAIETAEGAFDVSVLWWENGTWQGTHADTALPRINGA